MPRTTESIFQKPPSRKVAFYAPGGGVQTFEDGLELLNRSEKTADIYDEVGDATGVDVREVCRSKVVIEDPAVMQTTNVAVGYARANALNEVGVYPNFVIGVSSGEFTAAAITRAMALYDTAQAAFQRGTDQQEEAGGLGGGFVVFHDRRAPSRKVKRAITSALADFEHSHLGGDHTPLKTMVTYATAEKEDLSRVLSEIPGVKRVLNLNGLLYPPHGKFVAGTQGKLETLIESLHKDGRIKDATVEMISTRTAKPMKKARTIGRSLVLQTTQPTNLRGGVTYVVNRGVLDHYDLGAGNSMSNSLEDFDLGVDALIHPVGDYELPGSRHGSNNEDAA